jgi:hypothetical protein
MSLAQKILSFNSRLSLEGITLPPGIRAMNPFAEPEVQRITNEFYHKFYNDDNPRYFIIGINPGRHGAAITGVPFTDTKRLQSELGIAYHGKESHEPSSVFVYEVIHTFGGPEKFYQSFYINSICPLGFVKEKNGKEVNYNYYDDKALMEAVGPFILEKLQEQIAFGLRRDKAFCLGEGKNLKYLKQINKEHQFFDEIIPLSHPRFVVQYKQKYKQAYVEDYLKKLALPHPPKGREHV